MSEFQQHTGTLAGGFTGPAWLADKAATAARAWQSAAWPTRKTEHFKYLTLATFNKTLPTLGSGSNTSSAQVTLDQLDVIDLDATRLVFVDGAFVASLSSPLVAGVNVLSQADSDAQQTALSQLDAGIDTDKHLFVNLNTARLSDGVVVQVAANTTLEKPLYIVQVATGSALACTRVLVQLGARANAEVIEHFMSLDAAAPVVNAVTQLAVGDDASLTHYRLNFEAETVRHLGAVHVDLARAARLRGFALTLGSDFNRVDYQVNHRGPGAELNLQGLYLPVRNQMADYHTNVCHWVPHCTSSEVFRGIIGDSAQAVFNGRIYIHPDAQKTLAELSNKNMLTSHKAEVNTKPELEIYADDVKCAHGATVSQLNDNARFYLQSRGLSRSEAEVMLSFGFVNELLEQLQNSAVGEHVFARLAKRFGRDQSLSIAAAE